MDKKAPKKLSLAPFFVIAIYTLGKDMNGFVAMVVEDMLSPDLLKKFQPFTDLNEHQLLQLCGAVEHRVLSSHEVLFYCGDSDSSDYFLVEGELEFIAADGKIRKVSRVDTQARV